MAQPDNPLLFNMDNSQTTLYTVGHTFFANGGVVLIGTERIKYLRAYDSSLQGLTRGYAGTAAAAHLAGAAISDQGALITTELPVVNVTTTERDQLVTPHEGDVVMNTTTDKLNVYNGTAWEAVTSA